jgi:general secretion pathway protein L
MMQASAQDALAPPSGLSRFVGWWIAELAGPASKPGVKAWRAVLLTAGTSLDVYLRQGAQSVRIGSLALDAPAAEWQTVADKLKRSGVSRGSVLLLLAESDVLRKRLPLPVGVRDVLRAVVANKVETIAPWPIEHAMFDCREAGLSADGTQIEIDVWVTGRQRVEQWLAQLAQYGLEPSAVDVGRGPDDMAGVNLITTAHDTALRQAKLKRRLVMSAALAVCLSGLSTGWLAYRYQVSSGLERQAQQALGAAKQVGHGDLDGRRKATAVAVARRVEQPVVSIVLEALSRVLPETASLDRLELRDGSVTLTGKAMDAPALIALIEASPHFKAVEFAAPTTRDETTNKSIFSISAKITPQLTIEPR